MQSRILARDKEICLLDSDNPYQAINPPIIQSTLFNFKNFEDFRQYRLHNRWQYCYTRGNNPTTKVLEEKLAQLERGEVCRVFSSGMAAITSSIISHVKSGEHVLFVNSIYGPTKSYADFLARMNIGHTHLLKLDIESISNHLQENTTMIFVESPGSNNLQVVDLRAIAKLAKSQKIITAIDNTYLTPLFQKPLELGFDISIQTCSKYIGGHADVIAGAVITSNRLMQNIDSFGFKLHGAVLSPHDAGLLIRGLRTLPSRLEAIQDTTIKVVNFLMNHHRVLKVYHPLSYSDTDKKIFWSQAQGFTALVSFELDAKNFADMAIFIDKLKTFHIGVSWGGYENLVVAPHVGNDFAEVTARGETPNLIRLALGLFDPQTIIDDLTQALN